jgi:NCAIR mutase (PurE)-related protein
MQPQSLSEVLERLSRGELTVEAAREAIEGHLRPQTAVTDSASVDLDRSRRCGFPEVIFCQGKTSDAVVEIVEALVKYGEPVLGTRASPEQAAAVLAHFPDAIYNPVARTIRLPSPKSGRTFGRVAVITAGTSDLPVAEEALETLRWMGCEADLIVDVGVAGPQRLAEQRHRFVGADAIVVAAGMEGALPSVVGGHVDCPVIAVPTSVGYGASFGGIAALLGMLNSCASNVTVVNIDAGFKGGYIAGLIAAQSRKSEVGDH